MVRAHFILRGIDRIGRANALRKVKAEDVKSLADQFKDYVARDRLPNMWRNQGVIKGRWGGGSFKWENNAPSTIKGKGFNGPLYSRPTKSSLKSSYKHTYTNRRAYRSVEAWHTLISTRPYAGYNHYGTDTIPARPFMGFIPGDLNWLNFHAVEMIARLAV